MAGLTLTDALASSLKKLNLYLFTFLCGCMCHRTTWRSHFCPPTMWLSGLVASPFTHGVISLALLVTSCRAPEKQFAVAFYMLLLKGMGMSILCFMGCIWLTAFRGLWGMSTTNIHLRWLLSRTSDVQRSKIHAKSSLLLTFGIHVYLIYSTYFLVALSLLEC